VLQSLLNEYLGLFSVTAEEDLGYREHQMLQDAGILPVSIVNN